MDIYLHIFIGIILILSVLSFFSLAPWVPTKSSDLSRINKLAKLKKGQKFLEIGCGTGNVSIYMAKQNKESHITGIELSLLFYCISKMRVFLNGLKNIDIKYGNALKKDLHTYDVMYVFGLPETISQKLAPKLKKEMKSGSVFMSYCFKMDTKYFHEIKDKPNKTTYAIYIYKLLSEKS